MRQVIHHHKALWKNRNFFISALYAIVFLIFSLAINYAAATYTVGLASDSVNDLFLDHLPTYNVNFVFIDGFGLFVLFIANLLICQPKRIPFVIKSIPLFIFIRAIFMTLTHIGSYPDQSPLETGDIIQKFIFSGDLFFSAHTGLPFLMALIYWPFRKLGIIFLVASVIFGASALLGHLQYSIDVFAAYLITYSIYEIARELFARDYSFSLNN